MLSGLNRRTTPLIYIQCCAQLIMADSNIEMKINVSSKEATRKIENATRAAEKLQKALDKLKEIEIGVEVVSIKKKWWQFWR